MSALQDTLARARDCHRRGDLHSTEQLCRQALSADGRDAATWQPRGSLTRRWDAAPGNGFDLQGCAQRSNSGNGSGAIEGLQAARKVEGGPRETQAAAGGEA